jgi:putative N6-adenine-specific DNA methylase
MRVHRFTAVHFGQLERQLARIAWELYLPERAEILPKVSLHSSRIFHSTAVAERVLAAAGMNRNETGARRTPSTTQRIYIRAVKDRFMVSLDGSGELLYRRGIKTQGGRAPLRETLAAAVLLLAGWDRSRLLVNPMCGSGTLAVEAALMAQNIPPGRYRKFAFQRWPGFQPGRWRHLLREAEKKIRIADRPLVFSSDSDGDACRRLASMLAKSDWAPAVRIEQRDFFDLKAPRPANGPGMLAINPPFGLRLENRDRARRLLVEIGRRLRACWRGWKLALLSPESNADTRLCLTLNKRPLVHGGRRLYLYSGRVG